MAFTTSQAGIDLIKSFEDCRLTAYQDSVGVWTIGYGHTNGVYAGMTITQAQAEEFLRSDLKTAENAVNGKVTYPITQNMFDALVSLTFNIGTGNFGSSTLLKKLNQGDINGAANEFDRWVYAGGKVEPGLVSRRAVEKEMFLNGATPSYDEIPISAQLTIQGSNVNVRSTPQTGSIVKQLNTGAVIQATGRVLINGDPWFHFADGWVSGQYVQGWVKDYNDNNRWWYVEKGYKYPVSTWKTIAGKDYCFGTDGYLFVECYIKSAVNNTYYWVDDDGVWLSQYNTTTPDPGYRVVENYAAENAYQG